MGSSHAKLMSANNRAAKGTKRFFAPASPQGSSSQMTAGPKTNSLGERPCHLQHLESCPCPCFSLGTIAVRPDKTQGSPICNRPALNLEGGRNPGPIDLQGVMLSLPLLYPALLSLASPTAAASPPSPRSATSAI